MLLRTHVFANTPQDFIYKQPNDLWGYDRLGRTSESGLQLVLIYDVWSELWALAKTHEYAKIEFII